MKKDAHGIFSAAFGIAAAGVAAVAGAPAWGAFALAFLLEAYRVEKDRQGSQVLGEVVGDNIAITEYLASQLKELAEHQKEFDNALAQNGLTIRGSAEAIGAIKIMARGLEHIGDKIDVFDVWIAQAERRFAEIKEDKRLPFLLKEIADQGAAISALKNAVEQLKSPAAINLFNAETARCIQETIRTEFEKKKQEETEPKLRPPGTRREENEFENLPLIECLRYHEQMVPVIGRDKELEELNLFAERDEAFLWWGIIGPGGTGKSRLALEWLQQLDPKWGAKGFLRANSLGDNWFNRAAEWKPEVPTVIVIDYAVRNAPHIQALFARWYSILEKRVFSPKLRVLLLDRNSDERAWFETVQPDCDTSTKKDYRESCHHKEGRPLVLHALHDWSHQVQVLDRVMSLRKKNRVTLQGADPEDVANIGRMTENGRPLYLIALGLLFSEHGELALRMEEDRSALLDFILHEEFRRWDHLAGSAPDLDPIITACIAETSALFPDSCFQVDDPFFSELLCHGLS